MREDRAKDFVFVLYVLVVLALTVVYFTVPERTAFLSNALDWWADVLGLIL